MISNNDSLRSFLKQAYIKELNNYHFYYSGIKNMENQVVKDLFLEISEGEAGLVDRINQILQTEEVEIPNWSFTRDYCTEPPNPTPFDPRKAKDKSYIDFCNEAIAMEWESFNFYLESSINCEHDELAKFLQQCVCLKGQIITRIKNLEDNL